MAQINPNASAYIDKYIDDLPLISNEICTNLRELIHQASNNVVEDWKWKIPIFQKNKMVCGFAAFKKHVSLTFFQGAIMRDTHQLFSEDCNAQNMRTIKFTASSEVNKVQLLDYFKEAFSLSETKIKKAPNKQPFKIPELLQKALNNNLVAKENFDKMAYTYQKEYAFYISEAKREATKLKRLEKVMLNLEQNIKMHEQYKC